MARIHLRDAQTGKLIERGLFSDEHCQRLTDLLPDGQDFSILELARGGDVCRAHKVESKAVLARRVVLHFLRLMIDELIETGDVYQLPFKKYARIRIVSKSKRMVRSIIARDKYPMVDIEKSRGIIYEMRIEFIRKGKKTYRVMRINRQRYVRLCKNVNEGKVYFRQ